LGHVTYACPDGLAGRVPSLMADAGIACKPASSSGVDEDSHAEATDFGFQMNQGQGTVELFGFYEPTTAEHCCMLSCGRNPLYWYWDLRLYRVVEEILKTAGAKPRI
jgi:hypothetical protein